MSDIITVHGFTFIRSGECAQCGICGCDPCPHFATKQGLAYCKIYNKRSQYCVPCGITHQGCIDFPDNPWVWVARGGHCDYTWERQDGGSMDDLPFLNGQNWNRAGGSPVDIIMRRVDVGTKLWAQSWNETGGEVLSFFVGVHGYPG